MKKNVSRIIALCLALMMALALVSCGDKKDSNAGGGTASPSPAAASPSPAAASPSDSGSSGGKTSSGKYATIDAYVKSDEVQAEIGPQIAEYEAEGMKMALYGEGDKLVYSFQYADTYDEETVKAAVDVMKEELEAQASVFEDVASALKLTVEVDNPVVVVQYLNGDGSMIYSQEFTAK